MTASPRRVVLASRSPRRLELALAEGWQVEVLPPAEEVEANEPPQGHAESLVDYVRRLAAAKARAVAATGVTGTILACDTLSEIDGCSLGKPIDREDARRMLTTLSGRRHRVVTGVCLWHRPELPPLEAAAESLLFMEPLAEDLLAWYLDSGMWQGKAGACGFQDERLPLRLLTGSPANVVGLPVELIEQMLADLDRCR